jgi:cytochrome bd-type quinol oxidase subunit 1
MDLDPVLLSRTQFAFVVSFHIIFPAFTIGLAAWLAVLEAAHLKRGRAIYRRIFEFWMKVFAVSFGMGVVTGIVMVFQFGTNWGVLAEKTGSIEGPLLGYGGVTVAGAAAAQASLSFLFWGAGLFVLPVIAIYTIGVYWIFRGKTRKGY